MSDALYTYDGARSAHRCIEGDASDSQGSLQQALRTLRAVRERYEIAHSMHPDQRCLSVQVALGYADICWVTAAIEALEKAVATSSI
jgi:hypothetical protein